MIRIQKCPYETQILISVSQSQYVPHALLRKVVEIELIQRCLICLKHSAPWCLYTSFWRPGNAQRLQQQPSHCEHSSKSLTSYGIQPGWEEMRAAGCASERKPEKELRLNTEKGFERQTELSLRREIAERWNVHSCQRTAAVLSLELHGKGSCRALKLRCDKKRRPKWRETKSEFFLANIWFTVAYFWQLLPLSEGGKKFSAAWFVSCCQSTVSYGSAIISKYTSRAQSRQCKVMYVMIWIFLAVSLPAGWYWGPDLHFASVSSCFRCVRCLETWQKSSLEVRFTSLFYAYSFK